MMLRDALMQAARADAIPEGAKGLWYVRKFSISNSLPVPRAKGRRVVIPPGSYTQLFRWTMETLHRSFGELVMQDTPDELVTHLGFMLRAKGNVLITGLGLGCVVRGCLANPNVETVTVIERDSDVMHLVADNIVSADDAPRLTIIMDDAVEWAKKTDGRFDCAWHDLWTDTEKGEPHLQLWHSELILAMHERVSFQGAWQLPRWYRRISKRAGFPQIL